MDAALCGGGDPNQGVTNTAVRLSSSAVNMVKAAIFMGDPMFKAGLSYDVGTCAAGGVCFSHFPCSGQSMTLTVWYSLMHAPLASTVLRLVRSSLIVMLRIRTAAMATMRRPIKDMGLSMVPRHWPLSRASLAKRSQCIHCPWRHNGSSCILWNCVAMTI